MPRFRLDIEYDGSQFAGWQHQADQLSVQEA
ncbi:MAG: tRNA pseudouridine(38-40) synthase TruA, partial [Mesorhizobium sp.]